jgi:haloalkane dehalogenase
MGNPEAVGRIVVTNSAAFPGRIPARIALCRLPVLGEVIVRGLNGFAGPASRMAMSARRLTPEERDGYLWPYRDWSSRIAVHRFVHDIPMEAGHPSRPVLDGITQGLGAFGGHRKIIVWGGRDFCFGAEFLGRWKAAWPDARVEFLPSVGHYVLEDGGTDVRRSIAQFITQPNEA